jgi:uncharacterized protein with FMN-binding domain
MLDPETKPVTATTRGKIILSVGFVLSSAAYVYWQHLVQLSGATAVAEAPPYSDSIITASKRKDSTTNVATPAGAAPTERPDTAPAPGSPTTTAPGPKTLPAAHTTSTRGVPQSSSATISVPQDETQSQTLPTAPAPSPLAEPDNTTAPAYSIAPTIAEAPQHLGSYADGEYTGNSADTVWGLLQVKAIVHDGAITDVQFLQYPSHRRRSAQISSWALPMLTSEAIQAQSAEVDIISQASTTSYGFRQSLSSALTQAKK